MSRPKCSLKVVSSRTGRVLTGTSAILHLTSREGGFDRFMDKYGEDVLRHAYEKLLHDSRKPKLRVV